MAVEARAAATRVATVASSSAQQARSRLATNEEPTSASTSCIDLTEVRATTTSPSHKPVGAPTIRGRSADVGSSSVLREMGARFGADFSAVRIHRDERADHAGAWALTQGEGIHLSPALGALDGVRARHVLAHELGHVIQQRAGARGATPLSEDRAEALADQAALAIVRGTAMPRLGAARPQAVQHKKKPAPPGGAILYVGMNNFAPEVAKLDAHYANVDISLTKVTVSDTESKFASGSKTFDLTVDADCDAFCATLSTDKKVITGSAALLKKQRNADRDDLAHVMRVYATTQDDGADRMSRVVLSGHSYGTKVYNSDEITHTSKGAILFEALVTLAGLFPRAAAQTRHLIVLACLAGEEDTVNEFYRKAFPSLVSFQGWTSLCPTGAGAASALSDWLDVTDKDPKKTLAKLPKGQSNWISGNYQEEGAQSDADLLSSLHADDATFQKYFDGDSVDADSHVGPLFEYYRRSRNASNRSTITGTDHAYAQKAADQSFRLRFWPGMVSHFQSTNKTALDAAKVPDVSKMTRKKALIAIQAFLTSAGSGADFNAAALLLKGLRDLDATILHDDWLEP